MPIGVDPDAFTRDGPPTLSPPTPCTFLFVGAAIERKSIDVQLVVKDHTGDVFYEGLS